MAVEFDVGRIRYDIQRKRVPKQWALLEETLRSMGETKDYDKKPWDLVGDSNGIVKERLDKKHAIDPSDIAIAQAGFDVALEFEKVELASDFLAFLPAPNARRVYDFLHCVRRALQWGTWAVDGPRIEKWLERAKVAICNCPDWASLNPGDRLNCHEVMMGRFIKLGASLQGKLRTSYLENLSGEADDEDIERTFGSEVRALSVGVGEITLGDLRDRLKRSSRNIGVPITILSLYITPNSLSYHMDTAIPDSTWIHSVSDAAEMVGIGRCLDSLLAKRNSFAFDHDEQIEDVVGWPLQLRQLLRNLFGEFRQKYTENPSYALLAVNMPYQGLPWQHLVADAVNFAFPPPLVSIMPNFGVLITAANQIPALDKPALICYPSLGLHIGDDIVRAAVEPVEGHLQRFRDNPPYTLAYITAHSSDTADAKTSASAANDELIMPELAVDTNRLLLAEQLDEALKASVLCILICGAGAPSATFFNDVGGLLSPFLMEQRGVMFASIADISPSTAATLGKYVLECQDRDEIMTAYSQAIREDPECYLFNVYGLPTTKMLGADPAA